jgi:hypothetical protein
MQFSIPFRWLGRALALLTVVHFAAIAQAQVETIDPNPTMPRDVGGRLTYRGHSGGGVRLGRETPREENPAETLLRSIDGTNYGRATGHSIFPGGAERRAVNNDTRRQLRSPPPTANMYFSERGAYEDRVYYPARGSYRTPVRQQTYYRAPPQEQRRRTSPDIAAKVRHSQRAITRPAAK